MKWLTTTGLSATAHLILAHGAGAPMTSPFLDQMARLIADHKITVHRFEFAYMAARRDGGARRPPPKIEFLVGEYSEAIRDLKPTLGAKARIFIGGKSMGGRVASLLADKFHAAHACDGLVCLGYPFHPTGKPETLRTAHLEQLKCPTLIVQGTRDPFGTKTEVASYALSKSIQVAWLADGDHDFKPRAASGATHATMLARAAESVAAFIKSV